MGPVAFLWHFVTGTLQVDLGFNFGRTFSLSF